MELFFSNPDVLWANEFPAPRFGQGGFVAALEGLYHKVLLVTCLPAIGAAAAWLICCWECITWGSNDLVLRHVGLERHLKPLSVSALHANACHCL